MRTPLYTGHSPGPHGVYGEGWPEYGIRWRRLEVLKINVGKPTCRQSANLKVTRIGLEGVGGK